MTLTFYDAAYPPSHPPAADGVAFYIGGDTPHVWTKAEIQAQKARFRLPIFVRSNPGVANATRDVTDAITQLHQIGAPQGTLVAWDMEMAADATYIAAVYHLMKAAKYTIIVYGSESTVFGNQNPDGLYWGAEWTNRSHIARGDQITQWESTAGFDESTALSTLPFWDTRPGPPSPSPTPSWEETLVQSLPVVKQGANGAAVRTVQGLCCARGHVAAIDGIFGPQTTIAVRAIQAAVKITQDGVVGQTTWTALITGAA